MPKDKYSKPEITHGIKRNGELSANMSVTVVEQGRNYGRWSIPYTQLQNIPKGRPIPILSKLGKVLGHCFAPQVQHYG